MTRKNKAIIKPYFKMLSWNNKKLENCEFEKLVLSGALYKKKDTFRFFTSQFALRYFVFDLTKAMMTIKHKESDNPNDSHIKNIPFRDIEVVSVIH